MTIVRNTAYILTAKTVGFALGIAVSIAVSRVLGPYQRGVYFLIGLITRTTVFFGELGMCSANTYFLGKRKRSFNEVHCNSIIISLGLAVLVYSIYGLSRNCLQQYVLKGVRPMFLLIAISLVPFSLYNTFWGGMMTGINRIALARKLDIIMSLVGCILTLVVLLVLRFGLGGLIGLWVMTVLGMTTAKVILANREQKLRLVFELSSLKQMLFYGFKGYIGNLTFFIYNRFDMFLINYFIGAAGVGQYSLAVVLAERISFVVSPIKEAAVPRISEIKNRSSELIGKVFRHTMLLSISVAGLIFMLAPWGVPFLYGVAYWPCVKPLLILCPGIIFIVLGGVVSGYFTYQIGKPHIPSICGWIVLTIYVPLTVAAVAKFGIVGAALTSTGAYFLDMSIMLWLFKRESGASLSELLIPRTSDIQDYVRLLSTTIRKLSAAER